MQINIWNFQYLRSMDLLRKCGRTILPQSNNLFARQETHFHPVKQYSCKPLRQPAALARGSSKFVLGHRISFTSRKTKVGKRVSAAMGEPQTIHTRKGDLRVFETEEELAKTLGDYVAGLSEATLGCRNAFTVVVSGGSLIRNLRKLAEPPHAGKIDWGRWHAFWVDERVVPKDHPESNYKLALDGLLSKVPIPPGHVCSINDALSPEGAAEDYETALQQLVKTGTIELSKTDNFPAFDLILLGMGPDGHVASLFPGHALLGEKEKWMTFIKDSPKPPPERITFTMPVINSAKNVCLVVTGANKAEPLKRVFDDGSDESLLPVQMVHPVDGVFTCFADKAATSKISS